MPPVLSAPPTAPPTGTGITPLRYGVGFTPSWVKNDPKFQTFLADQNQKSHQFYGGIGNWVQQGLSVVGDKAKVGINTIGFGATVLGLALQESYEVTSAYVQGLTNRPRLAPSHNLLKRTSSENDENPDPVTKGTNYFPVNNNFKVKQDSVEFKYNRRLEPSAKKVPTPEDPDTPTLEKPVVKVSQTIQKKSYGTTLHTPLLGSGLRVLQLDSSEALAKLANISEQSSVGLSNWLSKFAGDATISGSIDFGDTAIAYLPQSLGLDSFLIGTNALDALAETFKQAANQATINPPTIGIYSEVQIESKIIEIPELKPKNLPFEHWNVGSVEQVKNSIIFPEPVETNIEDLLTFMGKQTVSDKDFGEVDYSEIPSRDQFAISGDILDDQIKLDPETPQKIVANTIFDLSFLASAVTYFRQGLHEYPMQGINPTQVGKKVGEGEEKTVEISNAATLEAYNHTVIDKKIGNFPIEVEIKDENGKVIKADAEDTPDNSVSTAGNLLLGSIAGAMALGTTLGMSNQKSNSINFGMLTGLAAQTAGAAAAAVKAAGCACSNADFLGNRSSPICTPTQLPFNFGVAGKNPKATKGTGNNNLEGLASFMGGSEACMPSQINQEVETVLDLLRDIKYAVAINKEALLKTPKDIKREQEALEKMTKDLKKTNKERWETFKDAIRQDDSYLNKHYPVKPKLVERNADGTPK